VWYTDGAREPAERLTKGLDYSEEITAASDREAVISYGF
jgi:hypothetical protein